MALADFVFTLNGLTMGPGGVYEIASLTGLGAPVPSINDLPTISGGVVAARDIRPPRALTFTIEITGTPGADLATKVGNFATAWKVGVNVDTNLAYHFQGQTNDRYLVGRSRGWDFTLNQPATLGTLKVVAQFFSPDGQIYDGVTLLAVDF